MKQSILKAFEDFLALVDERAKIYDQDVDKIDETIKPFLLNPERHFEHFKLITEARWAIYLHNRLFPKFLRKLMPNSGSWSDEYLKKLDSLKSELLADTEPVELGFDILPSKLLDTPLEWEKLDKQIHLIEIKIGVTPIENLYPKAIDVRIEFEELDTIQIISSFPSTDFSKAGTYKIGMSEEGKFISSSKAGGEIQIGGEYKEQSAKIELGKSIEKKKESSKSMSYEFEYANKVLKIISSSVKSTAYWKLLRTTDNIPIGSQDFYLSVLIPKNIVELKYKGKLSVDIESWGTAALELENSIQLGKT